VGHIGGDKKNTYKIVVGKPEGKRLVMKWHWWEDNIKIDIEEIVCEGANTVMNLWIL